MMELTHNSKKIIKKSLIIIPFFALGFVSINLVNPITSSYADDMNVNVVVEPTLSMSLSDSEINLDIDASNYGNVVESDPLTVNVSTNNRTGYSLTLNGSNIQAPSEARTLADISTMQDITEDICRNTPLYSVSNTTYELTDTRDNNIYSIRRLDDGNCWMVENLKLKGSTTITPEDSDVTENFTLPESSTTNMTSDNKNIPLMYDGLDRDGDGVTDDTYDSYGAYYNWYTATANTGTYDTPGYAPSSICAKGWKLPTNDNYNELFGDSSVLDSSEIDAMNVIFAGFYSIDDNGGTYDLLNYAEYPTPDQKQNTHYYLREDDDSIEHYSANWIGEAISVRCIATTDEPIPYSDLKPTSSQNTTTIKTIPTQISRNVWQSSSDYNNQYGFAHDNTNLLASDNFIPVYTDTNPTIIKNTDSASKTSNTNITFATKIDSNQLAGNYSNNITISAVANYDMFDWKNPFGIVYMQQMTSKICSNATTPLPSATDLDTDGSHKGDPNYVPQATLVDTRGDGLGHEQTYVVRKLADGNCWMVQNLNLNLVVGNKLTPINSDVSVDWNPDYSTGIDDPNVEGYQNVPARGAYYTTESVSASYDRGSYYCYGFGYGENQNCGPSNSGDSTNHVGNLYNWYAATAGSGTTEISGSDYIITTDAPDSICPKGWQLPTGGRSSAINANGIKYSLYNLLATSYSIGENREGSVKIRQIPLSFILSGYYYSYTSEVDYHDVSDLYNVGLTGSYWTSSASSGSGAYDLEFYPSSVYPERNEGRDYLHVIRCVAR